MESAKDVGRTVGALLLLQGVVGALVNFWLVGPVMKVPGFLVSAAPNATQVGFGVLAGIAMAALSLAVAVAAWPVFRRYSERLAIAYVALAGVCFALLAVENIAVMAMLSLSQAHATVAAGDADSLQALAAVVGSLRRWTHYTQLIVASGMLFLFYGALYRFALVPRALAAPGLAAILLQVTAFALPLFGERMMFRLIMPMAVVHLTVLAWLIVKGFADRETVTP